MVDKRIINKVEWIVPIRAYGLGLVVDVDPDTLEASVLDRFHDHCLKTPQMTPDALGLFRATKEFTALEENDPTFITLFVEAMREQASEVMGCGFFDFAHYAVAPAQDIDPDLILIVFKTKETLERDYGKDDK